MAGRAAMLEAVVHQHLPIFHTEHCVFCRFLSTGARAGGGGKRGGGGGGAPRAGHSTL